MLKMLLVTLTMMSTIMTYVKHPFTFSFLLLMQTMMISTTTRLLCNSSWISLTLFLIMVGGLMIIFMYSTSICSNQRFNKTPLNFTIIYCLLWMPIMMSQNNFFMKYESLTINNLQYKEFFKMFTPININNSIFMFLYLMLALMVMINLLNFNMGPMRKKY
uniref:NADH dehydrogenase subunit 6 n=1 Tax=Paracarsidara gigantea TaxID=2218136 RepID=A0A344A2L8_9HEMI|nr:NADH dehydrogenase subunit 6 [Paracarsidara gigantea]AWU49009.1 NADH dehydrogenase subunit 6 [Paracarsidara gigantea]